MNERARGQLTEEERLAKEPLGSVLGSFKSQIFFDASRVPGLVLSELTTRRVPEARAEDLRTISDACSEIFTVLTGLNQQVAPELAQGLHVLGIAIGNRQQQLVDTRSPRISVPLL